MRGTILCLFVLLLLHVPSGGVAQDRYDDRGREALPELNAIRNAKDLLEIGVDPRLTRAAGDHAIDMQANGFFGHAGSDGSSVGDRVRRQGYQFCSVAENISSGQGALQAVLSDWMNSPSHRRNIVNARMQDFGLVRASGDIWVMVLGQPGC